MMTKSHLVLSDGFLIPRIDKLILSPATGSGFVIKILINELLKRLPSDIDTIASFNIPNDCQKLERHAHNLSGSLSTMKLKNGHSLSRSIEMACRDKKDDVVIREMVSGLLPYLKELLEATKEYLK
jgi:HPt (histidine-containing phosphotransfer) domain-containing protein